MSPSQQTRLSASVADAKPENTINGTDGDDFINDTSGDDVINAGAGNDAIFSTSGSDTIDAGAGDDTVDFLHNVNTSADLVAITGTGNDTVFVSGLFTGTTGSYSLNVDLGAGADRLWVADLAENGFTVTLGAGADEIVLNASARERIELGPIRITDFEVGAGGDYIDAQFFMNNFFNSGGDTVRWVDVGNDMVLQIGTFDTGVFFDVLVLENTQFDTLGSVNTNIVAGRLGEKFFGTSGDDNFVGTDRNDTFTDGFGGNDTFIGNGGDDQFTIQRFGGSNNNVTVDGGDGNDSLFIDASVGGLITIDMGAGDDFIGLFRNPTFTTAITLGAGSDTVQQLSTATATIVDFETGDGGDIFDLDITQSSVDNNGDPFGTGELVLFQDGNDVILQRVSQFTDGTITTLAVFQNTLLENFTSFNFGGIIDPAAGGAGETFDGTEGADTYTGTAGADTINGNGGDDTLDGADGDDSIDGGAGADTLTGGFGDDTILGGDGDDVITEAFGSNIIDGGLGNDTINIEGYFGSSFSLDADQIFGGAGNDTVNYERSSSERLIVDLGDGLDRIVFNQQPFFAEVTLGSGADIVDLNGLGSGTFITTRPIIITDFETGDGGDQLAWETFVRLQTDNVDTVDFNPFSFRETSLTQVGNDVQLEWTFDTLNGASTLVIFRNTQASDFTDFNFGFDLDAPSPPGDDFVGTSDGDRYEGTNLDDTAQGLAGGDNLVGRAGDDVLDGGDGSDFIDGGRGNDTLIGGADDDTLNGGSGDDQLSGGEGNDTLNGGTGVDIIDGGAGDDWLVFSGSSDTYIGGAGFDTLDFGGGGFGQGLSEAIDIDLTNFPTQGTFLLNGALITDIEEVFYSGEASPFDDRIIFGADFTFSQFINGGDGNDFLTGGGDADVIEGGSGDDTINGLGGDDQITGGDGNNVIDGGDGNDVITTGSGDDTILGGQGNDTITPGDGIDAVDAGAGDDRVAVTSFETGEVLDGGAGTDTLQIGDFDTALNFNFADIANGNESISNFEVFDFVLSFLNDTLILGESFTTAVELSAGSGDDMVTGGAGDDEIDGGQGSDILRGGSGNDIIRGEDFGNGTEFDQLYGEAGNDQLFGNGLLDGGVGNDFVSGSGELIGGDGDDNIVSFGVGDIIRGGAGDDDIFVRESGATILLEAGLNRDRIEGFASAVGATIIATAPNTQLQWTGIREGTVDQIEQIVDIAGTISDGGFAGFEIVGTELSDTISLTGGFGTNDVTILGSAPILGLGGNDDITGSLSDDTIFGGAGNDILRSSPGSDTLHGGVGDDRYIISHTGQTLVENAGQGNDTVVSFVDIEIGNHIETLELQGNARIGIGNDIANAIFGTNGNDQLFGAGGNDTLQGGFGDDLLDGGAGDDLLIGLAGNNTLRGGNGRDTLRSGTGNDTLDGGGGIDTVDFSQDAFGVTVDLSLTGPQNLAGGLGQDTLISIENVIGTPGEDTITGSDAANVIYGNGGLDVIDGGGNVDTVVFDGPLSQYTVVQFVDRTFGVEGPGGSAVLDNVEYLQFDDQTLRLLRGTGVSVTFDPNNPAAYQEAMNAIRDFKGNDLSGDEGSWLFIGSVDVNGDGDQDQILVNDAVGRFATVGTADDGLIYFEDHGWAGETRVAGIYIDPLVQNGTVEAGGPNDSQRRFRNDLRIKNINEVLGADDYNGDGIWEVYFALTDGTAYLRALMHADGNIRYANYQSEQQVRNYLEANGYGEETFGTWFDGSGAQSANAEVSAGTTVAMPAMALNPTDAFLSEAFG